MYSSDMYITPQYLNIDTILEYAGQVWHPGLTYEQSECLESLQKQAITIIYKNLDYQEALTIAGLPTVKNKWIDMCKNSSFKCRMIIIDYTIIYILRKKTLTALEK